MNLKHESQLVESYRKIMETPVYKLFINITVGAVLSDYSFWAQSRCSIHNEGHLFLDSHTQSSQLSYNEV